MGEGSKSDSVTRIKETRALLTLSQNSKLQSLDLKNAPFKIHDSDWLTLYMRRQCPRGSMKSFTVTLNSCMKREEIVRRMLDAFGDLR